MKYSRHKNLLGKENFSKIQKATVLVAGAGGLGCCVLQLLARVGFGTIHVFDPGIVDMPDLNRQILYDENDLGNFKAEVAATKLKHINSEINIVGYKSKFECSATLPDTDIAIDCLDNFQSRLELEKLFFDKGIPIIHAGATQFFGQVTTLIPDKTNKLSDIFGRDFLLSADSAPKDIFPPTVMNVASLQVSEAVKFVCGMRKDMLINKMMTIDLLTNTFEIIELSK